MQRPRQTKYTLLKKNPWFIVFLERLGVTSRKTADTIVITLVIIMLAVTFFSFMSLSKSSSDITVDNPPAEIPEL